MDCENRQIPEFQSSLIPKKSSKMVHILFVTSMYTYVIEV